MKKKLSKILGIALTIALLTSLVTVAAPAAALSQPSVTITAGQGTISTVNAGYTINLSVGKELRGSALTGSTSDVIRITFPAGTALAAITATVSAGPGWIGTATPPPTYGGPANINTGTWALGAAGTNSITYTLGANENIGESAEVRIAITAGITNPGTPGTYTLTVGTETGATPPVTKEAAVTSSSYSITAPVIPPLPGIATAYNAAGIMMNQATTIAAVIANAGAGGRIELTAGTYNEALTFNLASQTIISVAAPGEVVLNGTVLVTGGALTATGPGVTLDGITFTPAVAAAGIITVSSGAGGNTRIQNCTIASGTTPAVTVNGATGFVIDSNTITASANTGVALTNVADAGTISNNTINVGATGTAITSASNVVAPAKVTISGNTITGASGTGIALTGAAPVTLSNNTLSNLNNALTTGGGACTVTATGNTIDGCGAATPLTHAVVVTVGDTMNMNDNTISNTTAALAYAINNAGTLIARFNNFIGNTLNVASAAAGNAIDHNYWGAAAAAPGSVTGGIVAAQPLGATTSDGIYSNLAAVSSIGGTALGLDITALAAGVPNAAATQIFGLSKLDENPVSTVPMIIGVGEVIGYYDVFYNDTAGAGTATTQIQLRFYGSVTPYTKVYYSGGLTGAWVECGNSGVNVPGGYVWAIVTAAATSVPTIAELNGTPFALVEDKTVAAPALTAAAGATPVIGAYDISIEPTFTWGAVPGAIRYEIALCELPDFLIPEWSANADNNFYKADEPLLNSTTYYWRVRGVLGEPYQEGGTWITPSTPWAVGIFTTEAEPVEVTGPAITVDPVTPEVTVDIPPTNITVEPPAPAIPNYMLWIIVVVGAVLIIALIVLIVRTRRVV